MGTSSLPQPAAGRPSQRLQLPSPPMPAIKHADRQSMRTAITRLKTLAHPAEAKTSTAPPQGPAYAARPPTSSMKSSNMEVMMLGKGKGGRWES